MNKELRAAISEHFGEDTVLFDECDDVVIVPASSLMT
jgi:hypothetical protein